MAEDLGSYPIRFAGHERGLNMRRIVTTAIGIVLLLFGGVLATPTIGFRSVAHWSARKPGDRLVGGLARRAGTIRRWLRTVRHAMD